jgi:1-acyl-sn-glycerol-3-phosphate acyltransferase
MPPALTRALAWPRSILVYLLLSLYILLVGPPALIVAVALRRQRLLVALGLAGLRVFRRILGLRYDIDGLDHVDGHRPTVYCMNHASDVDVVVYDVLSWKQRRLKGLYKAELDRIPIFNLVLKVVDFVALQRGNREQTDQAIACATSMLRAGDSFLIAPEGTRSRTGELLSFKRGAFVMAIGAQVPIVPIAIAGGREAMPRGSAVIRPAVLRIRIGEPIPTTGLTDADRESLMGLVRDRIGALLRQACSDSGESSATSHPMPTTSK